MLFLQILGVIFLILLGVGGYFGFKFFRHIKGLANSDLHKLITVIPEMSLELEKADLADWQLRDKLIEQENTLRHLGLKHQGYYVTYGAAATIQLSLWSFKNAIAFVFYEGTPDSDDEDVHQPPTFCYECLAKLSDGGSVCVSNSEFADFLPRLKQHRLIKQTQLLKPASMLNTLKKRIPSGTKVLPLGDVKQYFEQSYEQMNEWLWREPQLRSEQVSTIMAQLGIEASEELYQELIDHGNMLRSDLRSKQIIRKLANNSKMSAAKWEEIREKLVVVHNDMNNSELVGAIYQLSPNITQAQEEMLDKLAEENAVGDAVQQFTHLCEEYGFARNAKKLAKVTEPVRGEIYVMP